MTLAGTTAQLCVSGDIYAEYEEVIRRPKLKLLVRQASCQAREWSQGEVRVTGLAEFDCIYSDLQCIAFVLRTEDHRAYR